MPNNQVVADNDDNYDDSAGDDVSGASVVMKWAKVTLLFQLGE